MSAQSARRPPLRNQNCSKNKGEQFCSAGINSTADRWAASTQNIVKGDKAIKKQLGSIFLAVILHTMGVNACAPAPIPAQSTSTPQTVPPTSTFTLAYTRILPTITPTVDPLNVQTIYDPNQQVYWLADANLAGNATLRAQLGVTGINPNGTMNYQTALKWVNALNAYDRGKGYLGHNNWQLPVTPSTDATCAVAQGSDGNSFGPSCMGSALGSLYSVFLGHTYPESVVSNFTNTVAPFHNLQPALYWSATDSGVAGQATFSFNIGIAFANTVKYNFMHVLPMRHGVIEATMPTGSGTLVPYSSGSAAGKAIYDKHTQITWILDANLAASSRFGISGTTTIQSANGVLTVPLINNNGAMLFATTKTWLRAMNNSSYAGASDWDMPTLSDLQTLHGNLRLQAGDPRMTKQGSVGPFTNLQPFFYWACMRDQDGSNQSPCNGKPAGDGPKKGANMEWAFNFSSGFQGTDQSNKWFYVIVYYPKNGVPDN
jgi:hypothetical protein